MSTGRRTAMTVGGLVVVLLLAGCTGDARPPVVTRTADATPVPAPAPERTRVPMWTPGPTVASEQTVRALELSWPDGTPVEIEVVAPAAIVRAVEGEDFLPFASPAPSTTWPLAVVVAIGRATSSDPDWSGSGPVMGGSDVAVWSDDPYAEDGGIYYVMDPDAATVWSLPSLLHGVVLSSRGTLGWLEAPGASQGVRYVRWQP